jgi:hypothetical protein
VLNERFWQSRFNGDSSVIGRTVRLNALEHVIIGVAPASSDVLSQDAKIWVPIAFTAENGRTRGRGISTCSRDSRQA